jgi:hypothetical protein
MGGYGSRSCRGFTGGLEEASDAVEDGDGVVEGLLVVAREDLDLVGEGADAAVAGLEEQAFALCGCRKLNGTAVFGARGLFDEALRFEGIDDASHGGRAYLLRVGELAEGEGAGEDDDGEGGQAGSIEAAGGVGPAQFTKQVDGGGVEGVGSFFGIDVFSG